MFNWENNGFWIFSSIINFDEEYISKSIGSPIKIPFTLVNELKQGKASI